MRTPISAFVLDDWPPLQVFTRMGRASVFDPCRRLLVPNNSEEAVRQGFVRYLHQVLGYPLDEIFTEENMVRWGDGRSRRRADIVVAKWDDDQETWTALLIVECKAPGLLLLDDHLEQLVSYDDVVQTETGLLVLTNGLTTHWYERTVEGPELLEAPVPYSRVLEVGEWELAEPSPPPPRPPFGPPSQDVRDLFLHAGWIGEASLTADHPRLFNIAGLFQLEPDGPSYTGEFRGYTFQSCGDRVTGFGNSLGGRWDGFYRYFHVAGPNGDSQIVSISVFGNILVRDHPRFGNTSGRTVLVVCVDDFKRRHCSLELDIDRFSREEPGHVKLWHDGRLTRGKRGAAKRADVVAFIRERAPHLVTGEHVMLGGWPSDRLATWADVRDMVERLIEYGLLRDAFRQEVAQAPGL